MFRPDASWTYALEHLQGRTVVVFGGTSGIDLSAAAQAKAAGSTVNCRRSMRTGPARPQRRKVLMVGRMADVTRSDTNVEALGQL